MIKRLFGSLVIFVAVSVLVVPVSAAALTLDKVVANDASESGEGADDLDTLVFTFSAATNVPSVTQSNIDDYFTVGSSHILDNIRSASWTSTSQLTVTIGSGATIVAGDTITPATTGSYIIKDSGGTTNITGSAVTVIGSFDHEIDDLDVTSVKANDIYVSGNYAYIADGENGLWVVDIDPADALSSTDQYDYSGGTANGIFVVDDYAFIADTSDGVVSIDVSSPSSPSKVDDLDTDGDQNDVFATDDHVYVADGDNGLVVMAVDSDGELSMVEDGFDVGGDAMDIYADDNYAYLAVDGEGLVIVDISDVDDTALSDDDIVGTFDSADNATGVYVDGDYAYVTDSSDGLYTVDISDPTDPTEADKQATEDTAYAVTVDDDYAFIADGSDLYIMDVSDPDSISEAEDPIVLDLDSGDEIVSVVIDGSTVFVAAEGSGVFSIDMSEIASGGNGDGPDYTDGDLYVDQNYVGSEYDGTREYPYLTIGAALDEAGSGDKVIVFPGTYDEDVDVDSKVELVGVGPSFVTISGQVTISAEDVVMRGFTITGGDYGIELDSDGDDAELTNNVITDTDSAGIHVDGATGVTLINNTLVKNNEDGILVEGSGTVEIRNNIVYDNDGDGIEVDSDTDETVAYNLSYSNGSSSSDNYVNCTKGTGGIDDEAPDFQDSTDNDFDWDSSGDDDDFKLDTGSPGIDEGDSSTTYNDADDTRNDMGAFGGPEAQYDDGDDPDDAGDPDATVSADAVTLTWDEAATNDLYGYWVKRSTSASGTYTALNDLPVIGAEYVDEDLTAGTYYYKVQSVDLFEDEGTVSDEVAVDVGGTIPLTTGPFSDVPATYEFASYIQTLKDLGITSGFPDATFKPMQEITRAEFLKMAVLAANANVSTYANVVPCFDDLATTHPMKAHICWAKAQGFVQGVGNNRFEAERRITRFEITKILLNVNGVGAGAFSTSSFTDVTLPEQISYIEEARSLGIVSGYGNGTFRPNYPALRQEAAKMIVLMRTVMGL